MRLDYVTSLQTDMPSVRYRMSVPAEHMRVNGYDIRIHPVFDADADIYVFSKHRNTMDALFAKTAADAGKRVVFDMCDNHFESIVQDGIVRDHYFRMCETATDITCPTPMMRSAIKYYTGREATVIDDPWEMPELEPGELDVPRVMWFGFYTGLNMIALEEADIQHPIELVTKPDDDVLGFAESKDNVTITPYSTEAMLSAFGRNNIAAIPSVHDSRCLTKSHNRLLEALRGGMVVCAAPLPSYEKFADFCYLDWDINAAIEKAMAEPDVAIQKVRDGQDYIRDRYSPERIGEKWQNFLFH